LAQAAALVRRALARIDQELLAEVEREVERAMGGDR
jgi:hypothetical protein